MAAGGLKNLAKINVGGHGLIGNVQKVRSGQNAARARKGIDLFHNAAAAPGDNSDTLAPKGDQGVQKVPQTCFAVL